MHVRRLLQHIGLASFPARHRLRSFSLRASVTFTACRSRMLLQAEVLQILQHLRKSSSVCMQKFVNLGHSRRDAIHRRYKALALAPPRLGQSKNQES
jgi:hypothetical protein